MKTSKTSKSNKVRPRTTFYPLSNNGKLPTEKGQQNKQGTSLIQESRRISRNATSSQEKPNTSMQSSENSTAGQIPVPACSRASLSYASAEVPLAGESSSKAPLSYASVEVPFSREGAEVPLVREGPEWLEVPSTSDNSQLPFNATSYQVTRSSSKRKRGPYKSEKLDMLTNGGKNPLIVEIPPTNFIEPVGDSATKLRYELSAIVKQVAGAPFYDNVELFFSKNYMELWARIDKYFKLSAESPEKFKILEAKGDFQVETLDQKRSKYETYCNKSMKDKYRKWKSNLNCNYYKKYSTDEERLAHRPDSVSEENWPKMLEIFAKEEFQARGRTNSHNRNQQVIRPSTRATTFTQVNYKLMSSDTGKFVTPSQFWLETHKSKKKAKVSREGARGSG